MRTIAPVESTGRFKSATGRPRVETGCGLLMQTPPPAGPLNMARATLTRGPGAASVFLPSQRCKGGSEKKPHIGCVRERPQEVTPASVRVQAEPQRDRCREQEPRFTNVSWEQS
ncbi:hypothetical protein AAFF_G00267400 [Aldrovandia affinis]|uniref:Uncharacterized protein n=1 Tax=Aldrovandia affinis TaxID=143900 RepID=A0AAD7W2H4_9TELE|nr:hypothetical protein AAFF_G00267400 [Aldrovandia affinis]